MDFPSIRNTFLALLLLVGFGSKAPVLGSGLMATVYDSPVAETVYALPTSYVLPTSYYATSTIYSTAAYVYPTSYVYPTAYYTTASYVATPTSYVVPTYVYRRSLLFPRRWVARPVYSTAYTYYPTTYYTPTVYTPTVYATSYSTPTVVQYPLVASSIPCAEETTVLSAPASAPAPVRSAPRVEPDERTPSAAGESISSEVTPPNESPKPQASGGTTTTPQPGSETPPPPAAPPDTGKQSPPAPTKFEDLPPPKSSAGGATASTPEPGSTTFRQARKPVAPPSGLSRGRIANILEGKVVSSETRQGEENVRVILSSRTGSFADRVAATDAYGRYAVRLPDGDWTVKVAMPSGRVYPVSEITIGGGQIIDNLGREIPSLTITR
jgi:hypothetical protein